MTTSNGKSAIESNEIQCPVCGYYCLGKGGVECIDKPSMVNTANDKVKSTEQSLPDYRQESVPSGDSTEEMRRGFELIAKKRKLYLASAISSKHHLLSGEEMRREFAARFGDAIDTEKDFDCGYARGWQAAIASKQEELNTVRLSERELELLGVIEQMREALMYVRPWFLTTEPELGLTQGAEELINAALALTPDMAALKEPCKKCGGEMKLGKAIAQTSTGLPDFPGGEVVTMSPGGSGKLVDCMKCSSCGWSVTKQGE